MATVAIGKAGAIKCWIACRSNLALSILIADKLEALTREETRKKFLKVVMNLNNTIILPGQTIGIIGGGQLGRMMALRLRHRDLG